MIAYLVTCLPTGKQYIGITARTLKRRWYEHTADADTRPGQSAIRRSIAKYGREQFTIEGLCCARTYADLLAVEKELIQQWQTRAPRGYNLTDGGQGANGIKRSAAHRGVLETRKQHHLRARASSRAAEAGLNGRVRYNQSREVAQ